MMRDAEISIHGTQSHTVYICWYGIIYPSRQREKLHRYVFKKFFSSKVPTDILPSFYMFIHKVDAHIYSSKYSHN